MSQSSDPRIKILIATVIVLVLGGIIAIIFSVQGENNSQSGKPVLELETKKFDYGNVSMAKGIVKKTVNLKNTGTGNLKITKLSTSCMCTKAMLKVAGKTSPKFGMPGHGGHNPSMWSQTIKPGESGQLEIYYDPNAHGPDATGPITRTVTILSNTNGQSGTMTNINFDGNVIK